MCSIEQNFASPRLRGFIARGKLVGGFFATICGIFGIYGGIVRIKVEDRRERGERGGGV